MESPSVAKENCLDQVHVRVSPNGSLDVCLKLLWRWSLDCIGDPEILEILEPWDKRASQAFMFLCSDFLVQKAKRSLRGKNTGNFRPSLHTPISDGRGVPCLFMTRLTLFPCSTLFLPSGNAYHVSYCLRVLTWTVSAASSLLSTCCLWPPCSTPCPVILSLPWWSAVTGAAELSFQIGPSFLAICLSAAQSYFLIESVLWSLGLVIGSWRNKTYTD